MKMKFLELIWEPGPRRDHIFRSSICWTSSWGQPFPGEPWERIWARKNIVRGIWKGESQKSLEANQLITRKNKTLPSFHNHSSLRNRKRHEMSPTPIPAVGQLSSQWSKANNQHTGLGGRWGMKIRCLSSRVRLFGEVLQKEKYSD